MRIGSLFAGIGGFDLAARWMGWSTAWYSEIDPYCNAVMAHHFPEATALGDITKVDWSTVEPVDLLCGGFPCQDVSQAGKRAGLAGARSGLWSEFARAIGDLRPRLVVVENVTGLFHRGFGTVLGDLAELGYDAEWQVLSAADVGAPHLRKRVWVVAYSDEERSYRGVERGTRGRAQPANSREAMGHSTNQRREAAAGAARWPAGQSGQLERSGEAMAHPAGDGRQRGWLEEPAGLEGAPGVEPHRCGPVGDQFAAAADSDTELDRLEGLVEAGATGGPTLGVREVPDASCGGQSMRRGPSGNGRHALRGDLSPEDRGVESWATEPDVGRVAHGVPHRVAQLRALGNSIVPECALRIFEAIERADMTTHDLLAREREVAE